MEIKELLHSMVNQASPRMVYGEPVSAEGRTIVPIARIRYGFGAGTGSKTGEESGARGGGGMVVEPMGVIEITRERTRFIPIGQTWKIALAVGIGVCMGRTLWRRRRSGR